MYLVFCKGEARWETGEGHRGRPKGEARGGQGEARGRPKGEAKGGGQGGQT